MITGHLVAGLAPHHSALPPGLRAFATESVTGALHVARHLGGQDGAPLAIAARDAFGSGFGQATLVAAGLAIAAAALTMLALHEPHHITRKDEP
ncbi:hypothetical protein ABT294_29890 [Nonomuraea sp. NPDC000554]|uniref:hypothetical protein n=1 Tax=Nonomuraea sp. NPDC000554 TaxID=3154259 RepID=UPI0033271155